MPLIIFVFFILFKPFVTFGSELFPEFQSLTEDEQSSFDEPHRFDSEYQSDILTYSIAFDWHYQFLSQTNRAQFSVGSTSEKEFSLSNHVKLKKNLTDELEFRWTFFDERNRDRQSVHNIIELAYWFLPNFAISTYGEPGYYKRTNDIGLAFLWRPSQFHEIRLFNTFVDITRPQRNNRNDTFDKNHLPYSQGIVGRVWSNPDSGNSEFIEYAFRYETPTQWFFPDENYRYDYWKKFFLLSSRWKLSENYLNFRSQYDQKVESRLQLDSSSPIPEKKMSTTRFQNHIEWEFPFIFLFTSSLSVGTQWVYREWISNEGKALQSDFLPYFWIKSNGFKRKTSVDKWQIGFELTWHRTSGSESIKPNISHDGRTEQRLNLSYDFHFSEETSLRVLATADLDKLFSDFNGLFEGGSAQLATSF